MEPLRILLVDKHVVFRKAVTALLARQPSLQVVGEVDGGREAIARARETRPHVILLDVVVPDSEGLEVMRAIKSEMPEVRVICMSLSGCDRDLFAAVKNGADGLLGKNDDSAQLFGMLEAARLGQAPVSRALAEQILQQFQHVEGRSGPFLKEMDVPSAPETRVVELVADGWSTPEIADALAIGIDAVQIHLHTVLAKLHRLNELPIAVRTVPQTVGVGIASD